MKSVSNADLIKVAKKVAKRKIVSDCVKLGTVGCALLTDSGNVYVGVSIEACCGIGFCAEHSAVASMITNREYEIKKIVAVTDKGLVLPPCGRCRELLYQLNEKNLSTEIVLSKTKSTTLKKLLPDLWQKKRWP
ncbi:MAG: cytidine deaminase [Candidatus Micrarchaeota archaeon]